MESTTESRVVGNAFVQQYYIQMHKDASQLHRFYLEQSSFVHGGAEVGSEKAVVGQKAIHEKIMSLGLNQVHTRIKQVECLSTLANGIVVQVTGDISVDGKPSRAFVQTFVLAPTTPKVYYVHNSIFRYQDDDLVSESEADELAHNAEHVAHHEAGQDEYTPSGDSTPEDSGKAAVTEYEHSTKQPDEERPEQQENENETTTWESFGEGDGTDVQNGQSGEEDEATPLPQPQEYTKEPTPVPVEEGPVTTFPTAETREVESEQQQKQPKTFASALSKSAGAKQIPPSAAPTSSKPTQPVPLPQRESKSKKLPSDVGGRGPPSQAAAAPQVAAASSTPAAPAEAPKKSVPVAPAISDSFQVFVGGLPPNVSDQDLRPVFEKYGTITEVRINPKNFAFVIFDNEESAKTVIASNDPFYLSGKRLNIEPKKERAGNSRWSGSYSAGGRGSGDNYGRRQGRPPFTGGVQRDKEQRERWGGQKPTGGNGSKRSVPSH